MNSIDAYLKLQELVLAVRHNSDNIAFNWDQWETDVDGLVREMAINKEPYFHTFRIALRYNIDKG